MEAGVRTEIRNTNFTLNEATSSDQAFSFSGGAAILSGVDLVVSDCNFERNRANLRGGAGMWFACEE